MFYKTIDLDRADLEVARSTADKQELRILAIFQKLPDYAMTSTEVAEIYRRLYGENILLTSVRRSVTDLGKAGHLYDTGLQRSGMYGRPNKVWRLLNSMVTFPADGPQGVQGEQNTEGHA